MFDKVNKRIVLPIVGTLLVLLLAVAYLFGYHKTSFAASWVLQGVAQGAATVPYEQLQGGLITLKVAADQGQVSSSLQPQVILACTNMDTHETSSIGLTPISVQSAAGSYILKIDLSSNWLDLPYPVDAGALESKPAAIITQKAGESAYSMSPAQLRASFADVVQYMLTTADHHYALPLGDGLLSCRFDVSLKDGRTSQLEGAASSPPMVIQFGRGLPPGTYPRDHSIPQAGSRLTWVVGPGDSTSASVGTFTPKQADLDELLKLQEARTDDQIRAIRHWDNGSAVGPWIEVALSEIARSGINPPRASRALALVSVAMNDAVAAQLRGGVNTAPCKLDSRIKTVDGACSDPTDSSDHAVVAGAASDVLAYIFPESSSLFKSMADQDVMAQMQAGTATRGSLDAGLALGKSVGDQVIARAKNDGSSAKWTGQAPQGTRYWVPTDPGYAPPVEPLAGTWRTWNLVSGSEFRPGPPPAPGSAQYEADLQEVYRLGSNLTIDEQELCSFWEDKKGSFTPPGHWNVIALQLVRAHALSTPDTALIFATLNTSQADAFIATWDTKYTYWSLRPITGVRRELDAGWQPYVITPPFPSYVSGHSTTSAAAAEVLAHFFPASAVQLRQWAADAAMSRLYGGIHFRTDNVVGAQLGDKVAGAALARLAQAEQQASAGAIDPGPAIPVER